MATYDACVGASGSVVRLALTLFDGTNQEVSWVCNHVQSGAGAGHLTRCYPGAKFGSEWAPFS